MEGRKVKGKGWGRGGGVKGLQRIQGYKVLR